MEKWYQENKNDEELIELYFEYKNNCIIDGIKPLSYKKFLLEYYQENLTMEYI